MPLLNDHQESTLEKEKKLYFLTAITKSFYYQIDSPL